MTLNFDPKLFPDPDLTLKLTLAITQSKHWHKLCTLHIRILQHSAVQEQLVHAKIINFLHCSDPVLYSSPFSGHV